MKKTIFLITLLATIFITWCSNKTTNSNGQDTINIWDTSNFSLISNLLTKYPFMRKMSKPDINEMKNWDAIQNGFYGPWKMDYELSNIDINDPLYKEQCLSWGFDFVSAENWKIVKNLAFKDIKNSPTIELTWKYDGRWLWLDFSSSQKNFLNQYWWLIMKTNSWFLQEMISRTSYEWDGSRQGGEGDERVDNYEKIGGHNTQYKRYPYNTILITSDLLLHIYHKLFSNSLKYYEETIARPTITNLSQSLFEKFDKLAQKTTDPELKKNYEFLAAYRAIPYAILIPNQELIDKISTMTQEWKDGDLSDEQITQLITQRGNTIFTKLSPTYQKAVQETISKILKADEANGKNILLETLSPNLIENFKEFNGLKFDFTQFKPRAHYTTDALLKTYFMAMKRLMREKLFFADQDVTKASLIMVNNIQDEDLVNFTTFYNAIQKLIGEDDDVNIHDLQKFIWNKQRTSDKQILQEIDTTIQKELMTLRPQKIMSVSYTTSTQEAITEQEAKDATAGFIFFGEKFTIDSRFFDQFTAWSAEKESIEKPRVQSALMVADNLINTPVTQKFATLRLEKNKAEFEISAEQITKYNKIKWNVAQNDILTKFNFETTIYHTRLKMLATLFIGKDKNAPYFMETPLYQNKLLNTYLGSYTELKHDTLLYVKQAYAELWGGGFGPCTLSIEPPALPVPKWYVEPNIDLIDQLITLSKDTNNYFTGEQYSQFIDYLQFVRKIAIAQTQNQKITDEEFEQLRTSYSTLYTISTPQKLFGYALQKEKRSSIIADIFTSGKYGPLYEAVGRPYLMTLMINDINGARMVVWPVFSHYEFYESQAWFQAQGWWRYTDQDWQNNYDTLKEEKILWLPLQEIIQINK